MTVKRFWLWLGFWVAGCALLVFGPRTVHWLGWMLALGVAQLLTMTRDQFRRKVSKGEVVLFAGLLVVLFIAIAFPLLFHVKWPVDPPEARVASALLAVLGIVINARRTFGRPKHRAA